MATAKKLPSGNWRVRAYIGDVNGKPKYKSFTASTKKEAEYLASEYLMSNKTKNEPLSITLGEAYDRYIESKDAILSPSTIRGYKSYRNETLQSLMDIKLKDITQEKIQIAINNESKAHSPKYVKNIHGLLASVLSEYYQDFKLTTVLPKAEKKEIYIPTNEEIQKLFSMAEGTPVEIPILLAACLGLRRSEITGLKWENYNGKTIAICSAKVQNEYNEWVVKPPKSYAGNRILDVPSFIAKKIDKTPHDSEYIVTLTGTAIYKRFNVLLNKAGIPHFRFHDLRHYNASIMLALGVPNKYAASRMGHSTDDMLKRVYQHLMQDKQNEINSKVNDFFENLSSKNPTT